MFRNITLLSALIILLALYGCTTSVSYNSPQHKEKQHIMSKKTNQSAQSAEITALKPYLDKSRLLLQELNNKYMWAKQNNINPSQEALMLLEFQIYDEQSNERAFQRLPWGGWSRNWCKRISKLEEQLKKVNTSTQKSYKFKFYIAFILSHSFVLRSEYQDSLRGNKSDINYYLENIHTYIDKCNIVYSEKDIEEDDSSITEKSDVESVKLNNIEVIQITNNSYNNLWPIGRVAQI